VIADGATLRFCLGTLHLGLVIPGFASIGASGDIKPQIRDSLLKFCVTHAAASGAASGKFGGG
jgi:hypothetical protein